MWYHYLTMSKKSSKVENSKSGSLIVGNWKMYKTIQEAENFLKTLAPLIAKSQATVYLAVPFTALHSVRKCADQLKISLEIGAQNMNDALEGAFTGEISAKMVKEAGGSFAILGHSERRHIFGESDAFINKKVKRALSENLQPILCLGETADERESGKTESILERQLQLGLEGLGELKNLVLAYEPVWAIGTGKVAQPIDAQDVHRFCRSYVRKHWGEAAAKSLSILYGGSVKPENAAELLALEEVDGFLVGGASLVPETFSQIVNLR